MIDPDRGTRTCADVVVTDGIVTGIEPGAPSTTSSDLDADDCVVAPGFVDVQVNGGFGVDVSTEPHRIDELATQLVQFGVTAFCPTVITGPVDVVPAAIDAVRRYRVATTDGTAGAARVLGLHLEGPFLAPERRGAHPAQHVRPPSIDEVRNWLELSGGSSASGGALAMVTLAPELPGAIDAVKMLADARVTVAAGHTAATAAQMVAAEECGVRGVTHLFNAMSGFGHREPGVVGATLASDRLIAGLIIDGSHLHPMTVDLAWRLLGPTRLALVSDSIAALGLPDGHYELGDVVVKVADGVTSTLDGTLAGSVLTMDRAVRNLMDATGCSLDDACRAASTTPAALIDVAAAGSGRLAVGRPADLVVLDRACHVVATVVDGVVAFDPDRRLT